MSINGINYMSIDEIENKSIPEKNLLKNTVAPIEQLGPVNRVEMTKIVLEFLVKCFYPAIIVVVLYALWPAFAGVDLKSLMGRLHSAKAGDYEFTFGQAQDVGAEIAPLNSKIAELERLASVTQSEILKLRDASSVAKPSAQETKMIQEKEKKLQANSDYTLLVFHRSTSKERAGTITKELLNQGFQSSDTETNFAELQKVTPEDNMVFVTYTVKGAEVLTEVEQEIARIAPGAVVRRNPRPINLRRGDIQLLVF